MDAERHAGVVEVLLQLLNGQTEDRLELLPGEVADALAGFHVLDEAGADAAEIHGPQIVLPLEAGVPQHLPQQLMIALLALFLLLPQRIPQILARLFHLRLARLGDLRQILASVLEEELAQRRTVLESTRTGGRGGQGRGRAVTAGNGSGLLLEEDLLEQRVPLHAGLLLLRQEVSVEAVVDILLASRRGTGHRAVGRVLAVAQTLGQESAIMRKRGARTRVKLLSFEINRRRKNSRGINKVVKYGMRYIDFMCVTCTCGCLRR